MAHLDAEAIPLERELIGEMLEEDGDRADEDRQHLAGSGERDGDGDAGADALMADDDEDGRDDGRECRIWRHGRADVHPAEGEHLERTAEDDAGRHVAEHEADERAGDERTVELALIEHRPHARDSCDEHEEQELNRTHFYIPLLVCFPCYYFPCVFLCAASIFSKDQSSPLSCRTFMASIFCSVASLRISTSMPMS